MCWRQADLALHRFRMERRARACRGAEREARQGTLGPQQHHGATRVPSGDRATTLSAEGKGVTQKRDATTTIMGIPSATERLTVFSSLGDSSWLSSKTYAFHVREHRCGLRESYIRINVSIHARVIQIIVSIASTLG